MRSARHAAGSVQLANHEVGTLQPVTRGDRGGAGAWRARARRHVRGRRARRGRLPRARRRPLLRHRGQARWPEGRGRAARTQGAATRPDARRRRGGTGAPAGIEDVPAWVGFGAACAAVDLPGEAAEQARSSRGRTGHRHRCRHHPLRARRRRRRTPQPVVHRRRRRRGRADPAGARSARRGVHSGSSCSSETLEPSPVLAAMGVDADHSLRVSVGWSSTAADVERFVEVFPGIVERLRGLRAP